MHQPGLVDDRCKAIHVRLAMMQNALCAYNVSSQLVSSDKGKFLEITNARLITQVGMINPFRLNSMETQGFPSAKPSALGATGPAL